MDLSTYRGRQRRLGAGMPYPVKAFVGRLTPDLDVVEIGAGAEAPGMTGRDPEGGLHFLIPLREDARGRTVRLHEALHGRERPLHEKFRKRYGEQAYQTAADLRLFLRYWPEQHRALRDLAATYIREGRAVLRAVSTFGEPPVIPAIWKHVVVCVLAVLLKTRGCLPLYVELCEAIVGLGLPLTLVTNAIDATREGNYGLALKRLKAWFDAKGKEWVPSPRYLPDKPPATDNPHYRRLDEMERHVFNIQRVMPMVDHPLLLKARTRVRSSHGMKLTMGRVVAAVASKGGVSRLYERKVRRPLQGGTVLIDGSGSMGWTPEMLRQLVDQLPYGTVAYYKGTDDMERGTLYIVAEKGKYYAQAMMPSCGAENNVDYYALKWLLRQNAPLLLVTDQRFAGGPGGQPEAAASLLRDHHDRILVIGSNNEALEFLKSERDSTGWKQNRY